MEEDKFDEPLLPGATTSAERSQNFQQHVKMGTRRKPTDIGRYPTVITTRQSNESSPARSGYRD